MIPGLDSAVMFMAQGGGAEHITGRVRFTNKNFFDEELTTDYGLLPSDESDVEIYENSTGMLVTLHIYVLPNAYSYIGLPYPYVLIVTFHDPVTMGPVEHEYAAASIGSVNLGAPTAMTMEGEEGTTYIHQLTKTQAESFQLSTWYNFSIGGEAVIDPNVYVTFGDISSSFGPGAVGYGKAGVMYGGSPPFGSVTNDQFFGSTLDVLILAPAGEYGMAGFTGDPANVTDITSVKVGSTPFTVEAVEEDGGLTLVLFIVSPSTSFNLLEPYTLEFIK